MKTREQIEERIAELERDIPEYDRLQYWERLDAAEQELYALEWVLEEDV